MNDTPTAGQLSAAIETQRQQEIESGDGSARQAAAAQDLANLLNQIWGLGAVVFPQIDKGFKVSYSVSWLSGGQGFVARVEWDYAEQKWHTPGVKREGGK